jgi:FkbM family methyltransferase
MRIPYRLSIINAFLRKSVGNRQHHVGFREFAINVFRRGKHARAMRWVDHIETLPESNRLHVWIRGMPKPFVFPQSGDFDLLCTTIDETCNPSHWHQFQIDQTRVSPEDVVVDCGGAEGLFALQASLVASQVYVIEPLDEFFRCLTETFKESPNVSVSQCCAGESDGVGQLYVDGFGSSQVSIGSTKTAPTSIRSLDSLFGNLERPVTYIKADIEGFELEMLRGAKGILKKSKPKLALTTYHAGAGNDVNEIERFLLSVRPDYSFLRKGLATSGRPVMLHAW